MAPDSDIEEAPRAATPWIVGVIVFVATVFAWMTVQVVQTSAWPWYAVLLFAMCWVGLGALAMSGFVMQIFTRLDSEGVSQITVGGVKRMLWKDVSTISERHMGTLVLSDSKSTITIAPIAYNDANAVHWWIRDHLRRATAPTLSKEQ
jgi:hypothetical protein